MNDVGYGSYDSPTFLGRQDKLMMGLSLMQMLMVMGTFAAWFVFSLMLVNLSMLERFLVIVPCEIITVVMLLVKVTVQTWRGELAEGWSGIAGAGGGGYVIYLGWMRKSTSALRTGMC